MLMKLLKLKIPYAANSNLRPIPNVVLLPYRTKFKNSSLTHGVYDVSNNLAQQCEFCLFGFINRVDYVNWPA